VVLTGKKLGGAVVQLDATLRAAWAYFRAHVRGQYLPSHVWSCFPSPGAGNKGPSGHSGGT